MLEVQIAVLVILLCLSAFFSGIETALMSVSSLKVKTLVRQKKRGADALQRIKSNPERLLVTILVGNNIVNISAAAIATSVATSMFGDVGVGIATGIMTLMVLMFGEITPKSYSTHNSERVALRVARTVEIITKILFPIVRSLEAFSNLMMRIFGKKGSEKLTEDELKTIVTIGAEQGIIKREVAGMMNSLIKFEKTHVGQVMTHKDEMLMIDGSKTIGEVIDFVVKTPYSRYPVYLENEDNIVGIVDVDEILAKLKSGKTKTKIAKISRKPYFVPSTKEVASLLYDFEARGTVIAVVVDEFGHVKGLVTVDDVMEEIVGDIFDKSKKPNIYIKRVSPSELLVDARVTVEMLDDYMDLGLPEREFDTIAGLIQKRTGEIPRKGEVIHLKKVKIIIEDSDEKTIKKVRIVKR
jgi:Mg2+/Co2+ transporter CorB